MNNKININLFFHPKEKRRLCKLQNIYGSVINKNDNCCYIGYNDNYSYNGNRYYGECYYFLYTDNDAIGCCDICPSNKYLGYHKFDCERVIILYNYEKYLDNIYVAEHVYFAQHSSKQGQWKKWEECDINYITDKPTLNIYVALGSHASYPKPGITFRVFCFGNDTCKKNQKYSTLIENYYNAIDINIPIRMKSLFNQVPEKEMTLFQKFLIPFSL